MKEICLKSPDFGVKPFPFAAARDIGGVSRLDRQVAGSLLVPSPGVARAICF
jgi:hypothetical protein